MPSEAQILDKPKVKGGQAKRSRGKVIKYVTDNEEFSVQIGCTDNWKKPESVFLIMRSWIRPSDCNDREVTCERITNLSNTFKKHFSSKRYKIFKDSIFDTFYILDFKYGEFKNSANPRMNIHIEFNLYQKDLDNLMPLTNYKANDSGVIVEDECRKLVDYIVEKNFFRGDKKFITHHDRKKCVV